MSRVKRAVFIAAGRGLRLGPRGRQIAKGLLPLGNTTPVERAIGLLRRAGIDEIAIVTGHLHEQYEALAARLGSGVRTLFNPLYASRGSAWSLAVGLQATEGPLVLLESDVVWEERALAALLDEDGSRLTVSGYTAAGDEVWAWAQGTGPGSRLAALSKDRKHRNAAPDGELVGLLRIDVALRAALLEAIACSRPGAYADYETLLVDVAARVPVAVTLVRDLVWGEIDNEAMYERVRRHVWRALAAADPETGLRP